MMALLPRFLLLELSQQPLHFGVQSSPSALANLRSSSWPSVNSPYLAWQAQHAYALLLRLRLRADPFLVGGHPIISNFLLCSREGYFAAADLIMIDVFQPVFYVRVPLQARIRLRPKVRLLVGPAELNRNEMVDLAALGHVAVAMPLAAGNAIGFINGLLFVVRDVANALVVIGFADHRKADRLADSHFVAHQLRETCRGFLVWYGEKRLARCFGLVGKLVVVGSGRNCCEQQC